MLNELKILLGIPLNDTTLDDQLTIIEQMTEKRLAALLGVSSVPASLSFIVTEVSIKRFNRIGSEGMTAHTVEGEQITYDSADFAEYDAEIDAWKKTQEDARGKWRIKFL